MTTSDEQSTDREDAQRRGNGTASGHRRDLEAAAIVSRRGVLWKAGLATVGTAAALTALDDRRAAAATNGNFILGNNNSASSTTELSGSASPVMQIDGASLGATGTTMIVTGPTGGAGLYVTGSSSGTTLGLAINGTGSGSANGIFGGSSSGVGVSGSSTSNTGVRGQSSTATGVDGSSTSGSGVSGTSASGSGVIGVSTSGTGVLASSATGTALKVHGKASFSRSGSSTVAKGHSTKSVSVPGLTGSSLVLVTLQSAASGLYLEAAVPASGKFTVHLNKHAPHSMKFAWFILN